MDRREGGGVNTLQQMWAPEKLEELSRPNDDGTFSSAAVCILAGITYRQVDYWTRRGALRPVGDVKGSGRIRSYEAAEVAAAKLIARLIGAGLTFEKAVEVVTTQRRDAGPPFSAELAEGVWLEVEWIEATS